MTVIIDGTAGITFNNSTTQAVAANAATTTTAGTLVGVISNSNTTTGLGYQALASNSASNCVAVGYQAGYVNTSGRTTAVGYQAGKNITTGDLNVCIGMNSGGTISGDGNIAIGYNSGSNNTTGVQNNYIGYNLLGSSSSVSYEIILGGNNATGKGTNTGFINPNGGNYQGNNSASWSTTSDQRLKKNIVDNIDGLNKITAVRVRNFEYRLPEEVTELNEHCAVPNTGVQLGVIAQELKEVLPDCVKTESTGVLSVDPDNLTWYMVNAIKDLKTIVDAQAAEIAELKAKVA